MRHEFLVRVRLQRDAEPLHAAGITHIIEQHTSDADTGKIPRCYQSRKQIELPIRPPHRRRIQHAFCLMRMARFRLHEHAHPLPR